LTAKVGVLADTHGQLRPGALEVLASCDLFVHAGDVGNPEILERLQAIAPVFAVRGNVDRGSWAVALPETQVVPVEEVQLYVLHDLNELEIDPIAAGFQAVISGHTHQPFVEERSGVLYLNPGSAGPRRFTRPISLARLDVRGRALNAEIIYLDP
jgi:putative phosphoesterase